MGSTGNVNQRKRGFFLTFEGSEGCGKSTQIAQLTDSLARSGVDPVIVREPGGTPVGEAIRELLQYSKVGDDLQAVPELLLFAASRAQLVREVIEPALLAGKLVISDRFLDSTTVYQGVGRKVPEVDVETVNRIAVGTCRPDLTILLDLEPEAGMDRIRTSREDTRRDRMEELPATFYGQVRQGYLELARREPARFHVIDAGRPADEISSEIFSTLSERCHVLK